MPWPKHRLTTSYRPCSGCGAHCDRAGEASAGQPCWGQVLFEVLPERPDCAMPSQHTCAGHGEAETYKPLRLAPEDPTLAQRPPLAGLGSV